MHTPNTAHVPCTPGCTVCPSGVTLGANSINGATITLGQMFTGNPPPAPRPLTTKQAAKAYRKAKAAHDAATAALREVQDALQAAYDAERDAGHALSRAHNDLVTAAERD